MEDHLRNKNRLMKEWEALCSYQAEPSVVSVAQSDANAKKNRSPDSVPCESQQFSEDTKYIMLNFKKNVYKIMTGQIHTSSSFLRVRVKHFQGTKTKQDGVNLKGKLWLLRG